MKRLMIPLVMVALGLWIAHPSFGQNKTMPVTTKSEKARMLYLEAVKTMEDANFQKFEDLILQALQEDPDFFMAHALLAAMPLYNGNEKLFREYAGKAVQCKARLSKAELLLKDAYAQLMVNTAADVTAIGKKLVDMFPKDRTPYYYLFIFQERIKDYLGQVEALNKAIELTEKPAVFYNSLGYACMNAGKFEDARIALDKYIESAPDNPNPYDSKGDYYMKVKDYQKAYENYMKAFSIDSNWSFSKALNAKTIADSPLSDTETLAERKIIIEAIRGEINASFNGEYEKWSGFFAHEPYTIWMQSSKDRYWIWKGWDEINNEMKNVVKPGRSGSVILEGLSDFRVRLYQDAALVYFTAKILTVGAGVKHKVIGREVRSLEKKDGQWKIVYLGTIYSSSYD